MEKKKISAKKAVADIRSGMSDAALMSKYLLSNAGLQSLFDKLVTAGYMDLAEILERTAFLGTVDISESFQPAEALKAEDGRQPSKSRAATRVNAQEAARDIRSGMDDFALMQKYRLSTKGLPRLFKKLMDVGLIQQIDIDRRNLGFEHTVALTEDMLSLSAALKALGLHHPAVATDKGPHRPHVVTDKTPTSAQREEPAPSVEEKVKSVALPDEKLYTRSMQTEADYRSFVRPWYENLSVVMLLLIVLFPFGLYACYRNSSLSTEVKAFAIVACLLLAIGCLIVISLLPNWLFPRFL
ncbi:MAG: hypothetical protein ACLQPD_10270 [Desulfomonilaceae bacterium]